MMINCLFYLWYHLQQKHEVQPTFRRVLSSKLRQLADAKKIEKVNLLFIHLPDTCYSLSIDWLKTHVVNTSKLTLGVSHWPRHLVGKKSFMSATENISEKIVGA
jgi:hypothetical protein